MDAETGSPAPIHCSSPRPSRRGRLGALPILAIDAVDDVGQLLRAYRCVEDLLVPTTSECRGPDVTAEQLHALISVLNDTLDHRIRRAQRAVSRVQKRSRYFQNAPHGA